MNKLSSGFSFSYTLLIKNFACIFIFFAFLIPLPQLEAQWCFPGNAWIASGGYGVDPPSFRIIPPSGSGCNSFVFTYNPITQCPLSPWPAPPFFGSAGLTDTCMLLSNGSWNGYFSANTEYCWGTHTFGGPIIYGTNGNLMRFSAALAIAGLLNPVNGSGTTVRPAVTWNSVSGANTYRLTIYRENCCINGVYDSVTSANEILIPPGILSGFYTYYWRVKPYGAAGEGPYSDPFSFTTGESQSPNVLYPPDNANGIKVNPILDWQDLIPSSKYWIQLSEQPGFETLLINDSNVTETLYQSPLLNYNTNYYWRVAAKNSFNWGPFSDWHFKTVYLPGQVILNYPSDNSISIPTSLTFKWYKAIETSLAGSSGFTKKSLIEEITNYQSPETIDKYGFELTLDTLLNPVVQDTSLIDTSRAVSGLNLGTVYYWRVKARNPMGWGQYSNWWKFTTVDNVPYLLSPADQQHDVPVGVFFDWSDIVDGLKYRLQVSAFSNFSALWIDDSSLTVSQKQVSPGILAYNSSYFWRVKARNSSGWGEYQSPFRFFTLITPPPDTVVHSPMLLTPQNGSLQNYSNILFSWNKISEADLKNGANSYSGKISSANVYWFELTEDTVSFSGLIRDTVLADTLKTLSLPGNSKTYFWRVKSKYNNLWAPFSGWWKFVTIPAEFDWNLAAAEIYPGITGISFVDQANGWLCQISNGYVFRTSDGGSNWEITFQDYGLRANSICFTDMINGQIASDGIGGYNYPWWNTMNGGTYWIPMLYMNYWSSHFVSVANTPEGIWQVGTLTTQGSYTTYPAIISAGTDNLLPQGITLNRVRGGKNNAWIAGDHGVIYRSLTQLYVGEDVNLTGISFNDDMTGYAAGGSKIFKSTNNGANWFRLYPLAEQAAYNDLYFANKDTGWVACTFEGEGVIIGTKNGGLTWDVQYKGPYSGNEFSFVNKKYGWLLCGNSVLRTKNINPFPITAPVLLSPVNGAIGQSLTPLLDWQDVQNAVKYRVQAATDSSFSNVIADDSTIINSLYTIPSGLLQNYTVYYWRAAAKNTDTWSSFSPHWSFRTYGVPASVILNQPANNSVNNNSDLTFNWFAAQVTKKTDGSSKLYKNLFISDNNSSIGNYWFELTTDTVSLSGLIRDSLLTDTTKTVSGLSYNTSYWWRVKAKNELGWGGFSNWWKFNTISGAPVLVSPVNNQTNVPVTPLLDWSDVASSTNYRIQVSAFSNFSLMWIDDSNVTVSQLQVKSGVLAYNSAYYWRVKAHNVSGWSDYQAPFRFFTLVNPPPTAPVLNLPANGSAGISLTPLLDWNDVSGAVKYRIQVSGESSFNTIISDDSSITESQYQVQAGMLSIGQTYYWRAAVKNNITWSGFSESWNFRTINVPAGVVLISPANNSTEQPQNIIFTWMKATEPMAVKSGSETNSDSKLTLKQSSDNLSIINYWFELTTDTVTMANSVVDSLLTDSLKTVNGLNTAAAYYWRAKARNENGWGVFSAWWKFTTVSGLPPSAPVLIYPANRASEITVTPLFDWSDIPGVLKYHIQVSAFSNFSVLWINDSSQAVSQFQVSPGILAYNSGYYWRVRARNSFGWGSYSSANVFYTQVSKPPAVPVLQLPLNGAVGVTLTPQLDWNDVTGALKYRVRVSSQPDFSVILVDDSAITASQFTVPFGLLSNNTTYFWKAASKGTSSWSDFSSAWSFRTFGMPGSVTLSYPQNNQIELPLSITFSWFKPGETSSAKPGFTENRIAPVLNVFSELISPDNLSGYWFELTNDTISFTGMILDSNITDTMKNVNGLNTAAVYYWRVKAKNELGWGAFSAWWKFTTLSGLPPNPPTLIAPLNRASGVVVTPLFDWSDVSGAEKYHIQVSAFSNFSTMWINDSSSAVSQFQVTPGILAYNSGYYWRVRAKNAAGWGSYQQPYVFYTLVTPPLQPPVLVSPVNNAVDISLNPLLDWNDVTNSVKYRLQLSADSNFSLPLIDDSTITLSSLNVPAGLLSGSTNYFWRTSVKVGTVWSAFSATWKFRTVASLSYPALLHPVNLDTGVVVTTLFDWSRVQGAEKYRLQVSAFYNFSVLWIDRYVTDTLYQTPPGVLAYNSRYFWRVKSLRSTDSSDYSGFSYFFTKLFPYTLETAQPEEIKTLQLMPEGDFNRNSNYTLEICKDTLFNELALKVNNLTSCTAEIKLETLEDYTTYFWRVTSSGGKKQVSGINVFVTYEIKRADVKVIPQRFALYNNYPNPFNPVTRIKFDIPQRTSERIQVKIAVYDILGREAAVLVNSELYPGSYETEWNAQSFSSGIYFCRMQTGEFTDIKKMVLLK